MQRIGVISDTHGKVPGEVREVFADVDFIVHAGDIGDLTTLNALKQIAPVTAVRGNMDRGTWAYMLRATETITVEGLVLYIIHDEGMMDLTPETSGIDAVIFGHTHSACIDCTGPVMRVNPGSATQPRGGAASVALITVDAGEIDAEIFALPIERDGPKHELIKERHCKG
ncbi:MAG: metallophosphoesterase [Spartobacteria bacterium]|nr:metallophosphoesterase [Spartobacteria bacterium]